MQHYPVNCDNASWENAVLHACYSQEQTSLLWKFHLKGNLPVMVRTILIVISILVSCKSMLLNLTLPKISNETLFVGLVSPTNSKRVQWNKLLWIKTRWDLEVIDLLQKWNKVNGNSRTHTKLRCLPIPKLWPRAILVQATLGLFYDR
jgi:hypothetical protein